MFLKIGKKLPFTSDIIFWKRLLSVYFIIGTEWVSVGSEVWEKYQESKHTEASGYLKENKCDGCLPWGLRFE